MCCSSLERSYVLSHGSGMYCPLSSFLLHTRDLSGGCGSPEILSPGHRCKGPATWLPSSSSSRVKRHRFEHPHSKWPLLPRSSPGQGRECVCVEQTPECITRETENQRLRDRKTGRGRQTAREQKPDTQKGQGTTHTKKETKKERWSSQKRKTEKKDREMRPEHVPI